MKSHYPSFLVTAPGAKPRALLDAIRAVENASAGFCRSWSGNDLASAFSTSEEAFGYLDHIQNELIRNRDEASKNADWQTSQYFLALTVNVGDLLQPAKVGHQTDFEKLTVGQGQMPAGSSTQPLSLNDALNKLKHRATNLVNFTVSPSGSHELFIFTTAGMGKPNSISKFDVEKFCKACKFAARALLR